MSKRVRNSSKEARGIIMSMPSDDGSGDSHFLGKTRTLIVELSMIHLIRLILVIWIDASENQIPFLTLGDGVGVGVAGHLGVAGDVNLEAEV